MEKIETLNLDPKLIEILIKKLKALTDIKLGYYRRHFLEKRIMYRMNSLNLNTYQTYLKHISTHPEEIDLFLEKFTINYTYFFRNFEIFEKIKEFIDIYKVGQKKFIRIWSCPCATGEEPYSIAMYFNQLEKKYRNFPDYEIIASDIDKKALELAKRGIYGEYAFRDIPEFYKKTYFIKEKSDSNGFKYRIKKEIKDKVVFIKEDLIKGHVNSQKYDLIFCRNFIIYINKTSQKNVSKILGKHLDDNGLLILGKTEALTESNSYFKLYDPQNHFYVKNQFKLIEELKQEKDQLIKPPVKKAEKPINHLNKQINKSKKRGETLVKKPVEQIKRTKKQVEKPIKKGDTAEKKIIKPINQVKQIEHIKVNAKQVKKTLKTEEQQLKQIEIRFRQLELLEKQTDLLEKQLNKRINMAELLKKQVIQREQELELPEKNIRKREIELEQLEQHVRQLEKELRQREVRIQSRVKELDQLENQVEQRVKQLEKLEKQIEQRVEQKVRELEQLEKQIEKRGKQVEYRFEKKVQKLEELEKQVDQRAETVNISMDGPLDRVTKENIRGELVLPIGHYALINSKNKNIKPTKISIYGLGSSIALILKDNLNKIYAMSHILLPSGNLSSDSNQIERIYNYINSSVRDLLSELLSEGAKKANLKAVILGGAKVFNEEHSSVQKNINLIKEKLKSLKIPIEKEDIGGLSERTIVYDTKDNSIFVKKTWENYFRIINC